MSFVNFLDSFDHYATADLLKKWSSVSGTVAIVSSGGRRNGGYLSITPGESARSLKTLAASSHITVGVAVKLSENNIQATGHNLLMVLYHTDQPQIIVTIAKASKLLQVWRQAYDGIFNNPVLLATSAAALALDSWQHIELGAHISNTGAVELRINGSSAAGIPSTACDTSYTGSAICNGVALGAANTSYIKYYGLGTFDDLRVSYGDELAWYGDSRVDYVDLSANGTPQDWSVSSGNAFEALNGNGQHVWSATPGAISRFALADLGGTFYAIDTLQLIAEGDTTDAGSRAIKLLAQQGASESESADLYLSTARAVSVAEFRVDPATAAPWTPSGVNSLVVGAKVSA